MDKLTNEMLEALTQRFDVDWKSEWPHDEKHYEAKYDNHTFTASVHEVKDREMWPLGIMYSFGKHDRKGGHGYGCRTLDELIQAFEQNGLPIRTEIQLSMF